MKKKYETFKIYGNIINIWEHEVRSKDGYLKSVPVQYEVEYSEYDSDGNLIMTGTEDFSPERMSSELTKRFVWIWTGKFDQNGRRRFIFEDYIKYPKNKTALVKSYLLKNVYTDAWELQLRSK